MMGLAIKVEYKKHHMMQKFLDYAILSDNFTAATRE